MTNDEAIQICDKIRQIAYNLHEYLGAGFLEKVYENGLAHRLKNAGMNVQTQIPVRVFDEDGFVIGEYVVDLLVDGILIELKTVSTLLPIHTTQVINYLKATRMEHALLINYGSYKFQCKKIVIRN
ncbi:MAG: GxxExxY protein [Thermoguttaceae bacterium]|nr:GxxExxY protein [Thermoguttaceae bacterium]